MAKRSSVRTLALAGAALALIAAGALAVAPGTHSAALAATPPPALAGSGRVLTAADAAGSLSFRDISPGGTEVHGFAESAEPTTFSFTVKAASTTTTPPATGHGSPLSGIAVNLPGGGQISTGGATPPPVYATKHQLYQGGLLPNTAYDLDIAGMTQAGARLTAHTRFTTLKQRVRITLDTIDVSDDGDTFGAGEPTWFWQVGFSSGTVQDCYPQSAGQCQVGNVTEGTVYPYTSSGKAFAFVFAQENFQPLPNPNPQPGGEDFTMMPQQFVLNVSAKESDGFFGGLDALFDFGAWLQGNSQAEWTVPQGVEGARKSLSVSAEDGNFRSTMHFTFAVFYDNATYAPNDGRVTSSSK